MRAALCFGPRVILCITLAAIAAIPASAAASTNITGNVTTTTWTVSGSPYSVTGDTTVVAGATLTIEPGASIVFATTDDQAAGVNTTRAELKVNGMLSAQGTVSAPIRFSSAAGAAAVSQWDAVRLAGAPLSDARRVLVQGSIGGISVTGNAAIADSHVRRNGVGIDFATPGTVSVTDTTVSANQTGVRMQSVWSGSLVGNAILGNDVGIQTTFSSPPSSLSVGQNNLIGNTTNSWQQFANASIDVAAPGNWWGTTDSAAIDASILDGLDNAALGEVLYQAPLGAPSETAPPLLTVMSPAGGSSSEEHSPTLFGAARTAVGDTNAITVKVFAGATPTGSPLQTLFPTASSGFWSVPVASPLPDGTYTVRAEQPDDSGNVGFSAPVTFEVVTAPVTPPPPPETTPPTATTTTPAPAATGQRAAALKKCAKKKGAKTKKCRKRAAALPL